MCDNDGGGSAGLIEGTDTSGCDAGSFLMVDHLDFGNSTPTPTIGTGADLYVRDGIGILKGSRFRPMAIGVTAANVVTARSELKGASEIHNMWLVNEETGGYIMIFQNAGHRWGMKQDGADIDFVKLAGAGGGLKINGALITEGAADSGGAGYALLRVPN